MERKKTQKRSGGIDRRAVAVIRRAVAGYEASQSELARRYGVSHTAIWKIVNRRSFKDIS